MIIINIKSKVEKKGETSKETMINQHSINIRGTKCLR